MPTDSNARLEALYAKLKGWISIAEFEAAMNVYFLGPRTPEETGAYRMKSGALKKLRDEVTPVLHHVQLTKAKGEICFALSDRIPDCWMRENATAAPQGVEVTVAQSREGHLLGKELNEKGMGRGFLGLPDNAPSEAFKTRLASPRVMYAPASALKVIGDGIKACLTKKTNQKYAGHDLIIEAPLRSLPKERWAVIRNELKMAASQTPFREVHVISNDTKPFGFQIK